MHTLIDFISMTKGVEYLIAIAFMLGFILFWRYLTQPAVQPVRVSLPNWAAGIRDVIGGFLVPEGLYFHQGHTWMRYDGNNVATVGLDDFAQKLVGKIDTVHLPNIGSQVRQGEKGWTLEVDSRPIDMLSPVDGEVLSINEEVTHSPGAINRDPYGKGWLMKIRTPRILANSKSLLSGNLSKKWMEQVRENLLSRLDYNLGLIYQDGGVPVDGMAKNLDPDKWDEIVKEFFLTSEEG
ncbi:MAG: glycine cleavage system protein H [candidate division KSB1 bacterium]|nr:glycine cleavage system protein H [candidate division KSB1 bacterium]